jgi:ribosomal protein S6
LNLKYKNYGKIIISEAKYTFLQKIIISEAKYTFLQKIMKNYELTCLVSPDLLEIELESFQEKIIALLQKEQGILLDEIQPKPVKKRLGYPIKKTNQAYLISFNFKINPENLENLKKELKMDQAIIRYSLLVKKLSKKIERQRRGRPAKISKKNSQSKVELKEIEKKLEEILGE